MKTRILNGKVVLQNEGGLFVFPVADLDAAIIALTKAKAEVRLQRAQDAPQRIISPKRYQHKPRINRLDLMEVELRKSGSAKSGYLLLEDGFTRGNMKARAGEILRRRNKGLKLRGEYILRFRKHGTEAWEERRVQYA